jgi:hypothetical protein
MALNGSGIRDRARVLRISPRVTVPALAILWPTPGMLVILKLPVMGLLIGLSFLLLGEFSASEIALGRSLVRWRATPEHPPGEV